MAEQSKFQSQIKFIPDEDKGYEFKPDRPSNPGKQAVAGFSDIFTSIPSLVGLVGAGGESLYNYATTDDSMKDSWDKAASSGFDHSMLDLGSRLRNKVNEKLDVEEPVSTEDQAARILGGSVIPLPSSLASTTAGKTAAWLTPLVRVGGPKVLGLGTAGRIGAQVGASAAIDQGTRALLDEPLMFSDEALNGTKPEESVAQVIDQEPSYTFTPDENSGYTFTPESNFIENEAAISQFEPFIKLDREIEEQQRRSQYVTAAIFGAALIGGYAARKKIKAGMFGENASRQTIKTDINEAAQDIYSGLVDFRNAEKRALRKAGWGEDVVQAHADQIDTQVNSLGITQQFLREGKARVTGRQVKPFTTIRAEYQGLDEETRKILNEGMKAKSELAHAQRTGNMPKLLGSDRLPLLERDLVEASNRLDRNPALTAMANDLRENMNAVLDDAVELGVINADTVSRWRDDFTLNGQDVYMPFYKQDLDEKKLLKRLGDKMWPVKQAEDEAQIGRWKGRSYDQDAEYRAVIDPIAATERYITETIEYVNRNAAGNNLMKHLAHRRFDRNLDEFVPDDRVDGQRSALLVGSRETDADAINFDQHFVNDQSSFAKNAIKEFENNSQNVLASDKVVSFRSNGREFFYYVPDKSIRDIVRYNPKLYGFMKFNNFWKDLFTQGTTGNLSLFAPISNIYSIKQIGFNAALTNDSLTEIPKAALDSAIGSWELFANRASKQLADTLTMRLHSNTGMAQIAPQFTEQLRNTMQRRFEESIINPILRESGAFKTSLGSTADGMKAVEDAIPDITKSGWTNFAKETWHMWKHVNEALREGPALGRALREVDDLGNRLDVRRGTRKAKDLSGDFSRVGSHGIAKGINSSVPFSGAMIQSWNSIGKAIAKNPSKVLPTIIASTGLPTAIGLAWNAALDKAYPEMGYMNHYWNTLTSSQRVSNSVMYIPGQPPENAVLLPEAPEFSLFRAMTIEGMDAAFGLSSYGTANNGRADTLGMNGDNALEALWRVLDIPLPPLIAAGSSALGQDLRIGPNEQINPEGGTSFSIASGRPLLTGQKLVGSGLNDKYVLDTIDQQYSAILQDIFGTAGATFVSVANAFNANLDRGPLEATKDAFDQLIEDSRRQARYVQPLFGKALRPNPNDEINKEVLSKVNALKRLSKDFGVLQTGGFGTSEKPIPGNTVEPTNDPIYAYVASSADAILKDLQNTNDQVSRLRSEIASLGNADRNLLTGEPMSIREKDEQIDMRKVQITELKYQQAMILRFYEDAISQKISKVFNKPDYRFTFDSLNNRSTGAGIASQSPR